MLNKEQIQFYYAMIEKPSSSNLCDFFKGIFSEPTSQSQSNPNSNINPVADLDSDSLTLSWVSSDFPQERLSIYRNTMIKNLVYSLSLTYPGVWRLLGENCANTSARLYLKTCKIFPHTGCLDDWGKGFADFLNTIPELKSLYYLSDYANYEWLKHECECYPEESSLKMITSSYNLGQIEKMLDDEKSKNIQLEEKPTYGIIVKEEGVINTYWVTKQQMDKIKFYYDKSGMR